MNYDQRTYGKNDYEGEISFSLSGFENINGNKVNGVWHDTLYDIDYVNYEALEPNEYDEYLYKDNFCLVLITKTSGENNELYHNTFKKIMKSVKVDTDKYKDY